MSLHPYESLYETDRLAYDILHSGFEKQGLRLASGTRVKPTMWAVYNGVTKEGVRGVVVGLARNRLSIRVKIDGRKTTSVYWAGFWTKE